MISKQDKKDLILIVDDQPNNLKVLASVLGRKYILSAAPNGESALKILKRIKPDLILLDVMMSEMNGFETCRKIKSNHQTKEIPVIFLTAKTEIEDVIQGFDLEAVDYVSKPFIPKEILAKVENHLNFSKAKKTIEEQNSKIKDLNRKLSESKKKLEQANQKLRKFDKKSG